MDRLLRLPESGPSRPVLWAAGDRFLRRIDSGGASAFCLEDSSTDNERGSREGI